MILALIFIPLERIFHLHEDQKVLRRQFTTDLIYVFLIAQITKLALAVVAFAAMIAIDALIPPALGEAAGVAKVPPLAPCQ